MLKIPLVSVIYVSYNCTQLLLNSIRSLHEHCTSIPFEIIIVDNASSAAEISMLKEAVAHDEGIRVVYSGKNLGFGKANNVGSEEAAGKYLFFLNPDTIILNDVVSIFYRFMESAGEQAAACGGNLLRPDHSPNDSYGNFPGILLELCNIGLGLRFLFNRYFLEHVAIASEVRTDRLIKVPYIVGADILIRADIFSEVGGFDPAYFLYYEETDLFFRLARRGYSSFIIPEARIVHLEGASIGESRQEFNRAKFHHLLKSKMTYFRKWHQGSLPLLKLVIAVQLLVQYAKGKLGSDFGYIRHEFNSSVRAGGGSSGLPQGN